MRFGSPRDWTVSVWLQDWSSSATECSCGDPCSCGYPSCLKTGSSWSAWTIVVVARGPILVDATCPKLGSTRWGVVRYQASCVNQILWRIRRVSVAIVGHQGIPGDEPGQLRVIPSCTHPHQPGLRIRPHTQGPHKAVRKVRQRRNSAHEGFLTPRTILQPRHHGPAGIGDHPHRAQCILCSVSRKSPVQGFWQSGHSGEFKTPEYRPWSGAGSVLRCGPESCAARCESRHARPPPLHTLSAGGAGLICW